MVKKVEISYKTIIFTVFFLILLWFLVKIEEILFSLFVAFILMSALKPIVEWLERIRFPRIIAILSIYILLISVLIFIGSVMIPPIVTETIKLSESLPSYIQAIAPNINIDYVSLSQQLTPMGQDIFKFTIGVFGNLISFFAIFVLCFYMLLQRKNLEEFLKNITGELNALRIITVLSKIEDRLGSWVRGQLTLVLVIGFMTAISLYILRIPYLLPLSIIAGILEVVPNIGPILSSVPAIIIAFTISPFTGFAAAATYFIIQQAENHLIVPLVMKKVVGLPPLVTLISLLVGAKIAGIIGALLAVPLVVAIYTGFSEYLKFGQTNNQ